MKLSIPETSLTRRLHIVTDWGILVVLVGSLLDPRLRAFDIFIITMRTKEDSHGNRGWRKFPKIALYSEE